MKIATWNVNSVRIRKQNILNFLVNEKIDVICLQEIKTINEYFPFDIFYNQGFIHSYVRGEKSYNGVAVLSKIPIKEKTFNEFCGLKDSRHIKIVLANDIIIHNLYVPAGGDIPDVKVNRKFKHKINFMIELIKLFKYHKSEKMIVLGDFNIAPSEHDVWSHKQLLKVVSHTKLETDYFKKLINTVPLVDIVRDYFKMDKKIFSWWSYRNKNWRTSNRGRRLDHILISKDLIKFVNSVIIYEDIRSENNPSDHVPISMSLDI